MKPAAQSRIRKELVACLRYGLLVWMSTRGDRDGGGGAGRRSALSGGDPEPPEIDSQSGGKAGSGEAAESVLRSGSDRVRSVLAVDTAGRELRGDRAVRWCRPKRAIGSRPTGGMPRS